MSQRLSEKHLIQTSPPVQVDRRVTASVAWQPSLPSAPSSALQIEPHRVQLISFDRQALDSGSECTTL